jgi:drug/metabolite transporter (DMT)-like permease
MKRKNMSLYYLSAGVAIIGAVGYHYFVKMVPATINPVVSVIGLYLGVLALSFILLPLFPAEGGLRSHVRQLNWVQIAVAVTVMLIELGFLLMYRYGWDLSTGNLVTNVFINIILVALGLGLLGEKMSWVNALGIILSIIGVALISYRSV